MNKTIHELLGIANPPPKNFPRALPQQIPYAPLLYGVELEIESVGDPEQWKVPGIVYERDGSLRNNGMEFITSPMTYSNLKYCLETFFTKNPITPANYSERTSIHVHTNCLNLTWEQVKALCLVYQVLEKLLFVWVGGDRDKNIFCVPWHQTNLTYKALKDDHDVTKFRNWQKYTALNLLPLYTQGTVEWRHMYGHCDVQKILLWCQIINHIYAYVSVTSLEDVKKHIMTLNVSSEYNTLLTAIFKDLAPHFLALPNYEMELEAGILNTKYGMLEDAVKDVAPPPRPAMFEARVAQAEQGWPAMQRVGPLEAAVRNRRVAAPRPAPARRPELEGGVRLNDAFNDFNAFVRQQAAERALLNAQRQALDMQARHNDNFVVMDNIHEEPVPINPAPEVEF